MDLDPYGRPPSRTSGESAFLNDTAQARSGHTLSYGGRRFVGQVRRGGLLGSPAVLYGIPGAVIGYLLALFLTPPGAGTAGAPAAPRKAGNVKAKKVAQSWGDAAPPADAEVKLMLVVREDLGMSVGKTAAQCAHAAVGIVQKLTGKRSKLLAAWEACGQPKICVKCDSIEALLALAKAAEAKKLPVYVVQDAGRTEVAAGTTTVLAIGPGVVEDINSVTGELKLLR